MVCYSIEVLFDNLLLLPSGLCAAIARITPRKSRFNLVQSTTYMTPLTCPVTAVFTDRPGIVGIPHPPLLFQRSRPEDLQI